MATQVNKSAIVPQNVLDKVTKGRVQVGSKLQTSAPLNVNAPKEMPVRLSTGLDPAKYNAGGGVINPYGAPITSSAMSPTTPVKLPEPTIPTAPASTQSAIEASNAGLKAIPAPVTQAPTQADNLTQVMRNVLGVQEEIASAQANIDRQAQDTARQEADRYTSEIEANANATRRQVEELRKNNPQGVFGGALEDQIRDIERASLSEQADLSILQNAALRRFDTAKSIADRQLELKLEPLKLKLDNLKFFYQENKDILNKADDRAYQEKIRQQEREYNKTAEQEKELSATKVAMLTSAAQQGAPQSVQQAIQSAKTPEQAILSAGQYGGDMLARKIKLQAINKNNLEMSKLAAEIKATNATLNVPTVPGSQMSTVQTLLNSAKNDKFADQATKEKIAKSRLVIDQLGDLQKSIERQGSTGFIQGRAAKLFDLMGMDANAGLIQAQLTALVPQIAKGTYGEVGVLTNTDSENYKKTLGNLTNSKDKNDLVLAMTLNVVAKGLKGTLETEANNGVNMSGNIQIYNEIIAKKNEIEDRIGVTKTRLFEFGANNPEAQPIIKEALAKGVPPSEILSALGAIE